MDILSQIVFRISKEELSKIIGFNIDRIVNVEYYGEAYKLDDRAGITLTVQREVTRRLELKRGKE
jgi:hypothetical protein